MQVALAEGATLGVEERARLQSCHEVLPHVLETRWQRREEGAERSGLLSESVGLELATAQPLESGAQGLQFTRGVRHGSVAQDLG